MGYIKAKDITFRKLPERGVRDQPEVTDYVAFATFELRGSYNTAFMEDHEVQFLAEINQKFVWNINRDLIEDLNAVYRKVNEPTSDCIEARVQLNEIIRRLKEAE